MASITNLLPWMKIFLLDNHIKWFIYFRFVLPTIMLAHCLYIDGVKSFPINKIVFVCAGCLNPHMGPVDAANYTREPSLAARRETATKLIFSASGPEQATHLLPPLRQRILGGRRCHRWVVESCRSQRNATLQEFVASATAHGFSSSVAADRSAKSVSTPKLLVWKVVKKNFVCWQNIFSRIFGGITGISKSAILFVLTNFDQLYSPISKLIDLARCVKFNP